MTGPEDQAAGGAQERTRQLLARHGLVDSQVLITSTPTPTEFREQDLELSAFDLEFTPMVEVLQRRLETGRGLSIALAGRLAEARARTHAAIQLAVGLSRASYNVVLVDADFTQPGLSGLIQDPHLEGMIDMVRFGRSCTGVLRSPVPNGPKLLSVGSFPVQATRMFDVEALRSVIHRVSLHCDVALYITHLGTQNQMNPLLATCDQVVLAVVHEEQSSDKISNTVQRLQEDQIKLASVVLYDRTGGPRIVRPGLAAEGPQREQVPRDPVAHDAHLGTLPRSPLPSWEEEAQQRGQASAGVPVNLANAGESSTFGAESDDDVPVLELPSLTNAGSMGRAGDLQAPPPGDPTAGFGSEPPSLDESLIPPGDDSWSDSEDPLTGGEASDFPQQRSVAEAQAVTESLQLGETEFGYLEGSRYSRAPLILLITLILFIVGFLGWAIWTKQGIQNQVTEQLSSPEGAGLGANDAPPSKDVSGNSGLLGGPPEESPALPDDEAAAHSVGGGAKPPTPAKRSAAEASKAPAETGKGAASTEKAKSKETPPSTGSSAQQTSPKVGAEESVSVGRYTLHLTSYKTIALAYKDIAILQQIGYDARTVRTDLGAKGIYFRVYVGQFDTRAQANEVRQKILALPGYTYAQVMRNPTQ